MAKANCLKSQAEKKPGSGKHTHTHTHSAHTLACSLQLHFYRGAVVLYLICNATATRLLTLNAVCCMNAT